MDVQDRDVDEPDTAKPEKFNPLNWINWKESFENYLSSLSSHNNVPLTYVIRPIVDANYVFATEEEERIYSVALQGERYTRDRKRVFQILKGFIVGTDGNTWIKKFESTQNGRLAYRAMCQHYDGPGKKQKRITLARQIIADAHYRSEQSYPAVAMSPTRQF